MKLHLHHVSRYFRQEKVSDVNLVIKLFADKQQLAGADKQQQATPRLIIQQETVWCSSLLTSLLSLGLSTLRHR
jgi:hypothetical protein